MIVEVNFGVPIVIVNGLRIEHAPPIQELLEVLGTPSRVESGSQPAPVGFRNNQQHVFDSLGVYVNEHHYTRRAQELGIHLAGEQRYAFTPHSPFTGRLLFNGIPLPLIATEQEFLHSASCPFVEFRGNWSYQAAGYYFSFDAIGPQLRSGHRSKRRIVVDVSISWPHDPHEAPNDDDIRCIIE